MPRLAAMTLPGCPRSPSLAPYSPALPAGAAMRRPGRRLSPARAQPGDGGDDLDSIEAVQIAMLGDLPYTTVRDAILAHPTLMEGLIVLFSSTPVDVEAA